MGMTATHKDGAAYDPAASAARVFYVSAIDSWDTGRRYLVGGPYATHADAVAAMPMVRAAARALDRSADGMAWGTAGSAEGITTLLGPGPGYGAKLAGYGEPWQG
jgi:hypothetical protein